MIALSTVVVSLGLLVAPPPGGDPAGPGPLVTAPGPTSQTAAGVAPKVGWSWDVLPFAKAIRGDFERATPAELVQYLRGLRGRLMMDETNPVCEIGQDIELWLKFGLAAQRLYLLENTEFSRAMARDAAFGLYTLGRNYATRDDVRQSVDALPSGLTGPPKMYSDLVVQSVRMLRGYGFQWFAEVSAATLKDQGAAVETLYQTGVVARGEEQWAGAMQALSDALGIVITPSLAADAIDAMLQLDNPEADKSAHGLEAALLAKRPASKGQLEGIFRRHEDRRATAKFEADPTKASIAESLAQAGRYIRLQRPGAADVLLRQQLGTYPAAQEVWDRTADFYHGQQRFESLRNLFADAEQKGKLSTRLRIVRVSARAHLIIQEAAGAAHHPLADGDMEADLKVMATEGGPEGKLQVMMVRAVLALSKYMAAKGNTTMAPAERQAIDKAIAQTMDAMVAAYPKEVRVLEAILGTAIARDEAPAGIKRVSAMAAKLDDVARVGIELELLELELSFAIRDRAPELMKAAQQRAAGVEKLLGKLGALKDPARWPATIDKNEWTYVAWLVKATGLVLRGGAMPMEDPKADTDIVRGIAVLREVAGTFDAWTQHGQTLAQATALTLGSLLLRHNEAAALGAFDEARLADRTTVFASLAAGYKQMALADAMGAAELFERGLLRSDRPATRHLLHALAANARSALGDAKGASTHLNEAIAGWAAARVPEVPDPATMRPLSEGLYQLGIEMGYGEPATASVRVIPVMVLVPEASYAEAHKKAGNDPSGTAPRP